MKPPFFPSYGSLAFIRQLVEKENFNFQPAVFYLKIDLVSHPACAREAWYLQIHTYTHTHTHKYMHLGMYVYMGACTYVYNVYLRNNFSFIYVSINTLLKGCRFNFFNWHFPHTYKDWIKTVWCFVCLFEFYGISTFVGYLMPNPFLYKKTVLFQTILFSIRTQFNCQKHFYFKLFSFVKLL